MDLSILHAPSPLGLKAPAPGRVPGTCRGPEALRVAGLHARLAADYAGEVVPPEYDPRRDPELRILNPHAIRAYTQALADRAGGLLDARRFPLVLGGDCSVLLGCGLALRRRGSFALAFIDGHADMLIPTTSRTGGVAGMDLAMMIGIGPELLTDIGGLKPYVRDEHVVQLGCRDYDSVAVGPTRRVAGTEVLLVGCEEIQEAGPERAATGAVDRLSSAPDGVWIHLDVDVLDDEVMPAVDSRQAGGLSYAELTKLLTLLLDQLRIVGMDVTIYDPDLDPSGHYGRALSGALKDVLQARQ